MAKFLNDSMETQLQQAAKAKKLLHVYWAPSWCEASSAWRESLRSFPEWLELKNELASFEWNAEWNPEIDQAYQAFAQDRTASSGWPLNLFVDPQDRSIVFACSAMKPEDFCQVVKQLVVAWKLEAEALQSRAAEELAQFQDKDPLCTLGTAGGVARSVAKEAAKNPTENLTENLITASVLYRFLTPLEQSLDLTTGFVGQGQVFLYPEIYPPLLAYEDMSKFGELALVQIAKSPLYDIVHGGFLRTLDFDWSSHHSALNGSFDSRSVRSRSHEKLLVENCEMMMAYASAWKRTQNPFFTQIAHEVLETILQDFRYPNIEGASLASAVVLPEASLEVEAKDILESVPAKDRQALQLFLGLNEGRKIPYLATELSVLAEYLGEQPVDLRLSLMGARKKLKEHLRNKNAQEGTQKTANKVESWKLLPPSRIAELTAVKALAFVSLTFDTPGVQPLAESIFDRYQSEFSSEWTLRERGAYLRAATSLARLHQSQRDMQKAKSYFLEAERLLFSLNGTFFEEAQTQVPFLGHRLDLVDHLGASGFASMIHGVLDFEELRKSGLQGENDLPLDIHDDVNRALHRARPLGLHAASLYTALMRVLGPA